MTVAELIDELDKYPKDLNVLICDVNNDGDGSGFATLFPIADVDKEKAKDNDKIIDVVLIAYFG
jgi:hypothetical protein